MSWEQAVGAAGGGLLGLGSINLAGSVVPHAHDPGILLPIVWGLMLLGSLLGKG